MFWLAGISGAGFVRLARDLLPRYRTLSANIQDNSVLPKLLDVIEIPLSGAVPHNHQTENHVDDVTRRWANRGQIPWSDLEQLPSSPDSLWINSDRTINGAFNCISQAEAATLQNSLVLIKRASSSSR